jgi:hypothetical protein
MHRRTAQAQLRESIGSDATAEELGRLARVDALLRAAVADERETTTRLPVVTRLPARRSTPPDQGGQTHELMLTFAQLGLVYRALQAVKTLGALPPENELLGDTLELVDQALTDMV